MHHCTLWRQQFFVRFSWYLHIKKIFFCIFEQCVCSQKHGCVVICVVTCVAQSGGGNDCVGFRKRLGVCCDGRGSSVCDWGVCGVGDRVENSYQSHPNCVNSPPARADDVDESHTDASSLTCEKIFYPF